MTDESHGQKRLALYQYGSCPFCSRVLRAIDELGVEIELRDTLQEPESARELMAATGRMTVPVLRIEESDGSVRWMPESADIIRFLQTEASVA